MPSYANLRAVTGKRILVDTSFVATQQNNTWSNSPASTINARIADGVFGVIIEPAPSNYEQQITTIAPQLASTCD